MAKIVIIGGGVSGLSAGIYGALSGHEVTLLERHSVVGGNLTGWRRDGFTIDNCIHWLTGTNPTTESYKIWCELGALGDVEIVKCDTLYTYSDDEGEISLCRELSELREQMLRISPEDSGETESFIRAVRAVQGLSGIGGAAHDERLGMLELLSVSPVLLRYCRSSCAELAKRFRHPRLAGFIRSFLGDCFSSMALIFVFAHFCGGNADLPRGGSIAMAERIRERFISLGGKAITRAEVKRIRHTRGIADAAVLTDGREIEGDYFIFACDPKPAFERLLSLPLPRELAKKYERADLHRFSSLHTAIAVEGKPPFSGDFILPLPKKYKTRLLSEHLIIREFSHEPSFAPRGRSIMQTIIFIGEDASKHFIALRKKDPSAYKEKKARLARLTIDAILERFPELRGRLALLDSWTPASYERFTGAEVGSYMSFALPKSYIPLRTDPKIPGLKNVLLATQWQQAPGGLPTAAELGRAAIRKIDAAERAHLKIPAVKARGKFRSTEA